MTTILQACQAVALRIGLTQPSSVVSGGVALPSQYMHLLVETGHELARREGWQCLEREATFQTVVGDIQISNMAAEFPDLKRISEDTVVNLTTGVELKHASRRATTVLKMGAAPVISNLYRIRGNQFLLLGNVSQDETISFEYLSKYWITDRDTGERKASPQNDADVILFDLEAMVLGTKWRFKKENGLEYGEDFNDYEKYVHDLIGGDKPVGTISLEPSVNQQLLDATQQILLTAE